jgi:hypothetical protein
LGGLPGISLYLVTLCLGITPKSYTPTDLSAFRTSSPLYQSCPFGTYYQDQGNSYDWKGEGTILNAYNDESVGVYELFTFSETIGITETINNSSAYSVGYSNIINDTISSSTGHSVAESMSSSASVQISVYAPPYGTAFAQNGFDTINSHGYVYNETSSCQTTDIYNVSSTVSPYGKGPGGWHN